MRRRPFIQPKTPVYLGCEGKSEAAYGQCLNDLLKAAHLPIHIQVEVLAPGVGDPLDRVERAVQQIVRAKSRRVTFKLQAVLMDFDQAYGEPERAAEAKRLAARHDLAIIWQDPCHEALLLRHMPRCADRKPPTCAVALQALKTVWSEYNKPMSRAKLAERIDLEAIGRAAEVEPDLKAFFTRIRLLQ